MQNPTLVTVNDLDISRVSMTKPKKNKVGKLNSYLNWNGGAFMVETPNLHSFGVGRFEDKNNKDIKGAYNLTVTQRSDQQAEADRFFDFMKALDEKFIDFLIENSTQLMGEEYTRDDRKVVAGMYKKNRLIKPSKLSAEKVPYPSALKLALATRKSEEDDEEVPLLQIRRGKTNVEVSSFEELCEIIPKNTTVRAIITPRIYIMGSGSIVGIRWTVQAVKIPEVRRMTMPTTFTFSDETEEPVAAEATTTAAVEDDEAEAEEDAVEDDEEGEFEEVEEEE